MSNGRGYPFFLYRVGAPGTAPPPASVPGVVQYVLATLGHLALAEFPYPFNAQPPVPSGQGPAWRRWLAQRCNEAVLNQRPTNESVRDIIAHMFAEACELYPEAPSSFDVLKPFLPPDIEWPDEDSPEFIGKLGDYLGDLRRPVFDEDVALQVLLLASVDMMPAAPAGDDVDVVLEALLRATVH